jgi:hypothetical protein
LATARKYLLEHRFGHTLGQKGGLPVYRIVVPFVVLMLLAGCKGGTSSKPKVDTSPIVGTNTTPTNTATQTATNTSTANQEPKKYGQNQYTLDQLTKMLMVEDDKATSDHAKEEMKKIGKEQVEWLTKAMDGKKDYIKLNVLDILIASKDDWAKKEGKDLVPLLHKALRDGSGKVRQKASDVIVVLQFPESVEDLRARAKLDEDPATKRAMEDNLAKIK